MASACLQKSSALPVRMWCNFLCPVQNLGVVLDGSRMTVFSLGQTDIVFACSLRSRDLDGGGEDRGYNKREACTSNFRVLSGSDYRMLFSGKDLIRRTVTVECSSFGKRQVKSVYEVPAQLLLPSAMHTTHKQHHGANRACGSQTIMSDNKKCLRKSHQSFANWKSDLHLM